MRDHTVKALRSARRLRREMTLPEVLLWRILKQRPFGFKFRRQHPIGSYVVDFYCAERKLIVEIDGIAHDMGERPARDAYREGRLREAGLEIVRLPAVQVLKDVLGAADAIVGRCLAGPPPSVASRLPPPPAGEDPLAVRRTGNAVQSSPAGGGGSP